MRVRFPSPALGKKRVATPISPGRPVHDARCDDTIRPHGVHEPKLEDPGRRLYALFAAFIANALHEWCRFSRIGISYIEPGSPWENLYVESFNGRARDELLNVEEFARASKRRSLSKYGRSSTTATDPTKRSADSRPPK
jgi:transposase InsO family protein